MASEVATQVRSRAADSARSRWIAMKAMAVTMFHRVADPEVFDGWVCDVRSAAEAARGFVAFAASINRDTPLDWAVAVTFESEDVGPHQRGRRGDVGALGARRCGTGISAAFFGFGDH